MIHGVIAIDKPLGKTSHDCVSFVRRLIGQKRVGHTGTLDPEASGVLPICVGMATKASDFMMNSGKEYIAGVKLGITTDTQDATGEVLDRRDVSVTKEDIITAFCSFVGHIEQMPPMYSALKKDGQKLYQLARRGIEVERPTRHVFIENIELLDIDLEQNVFTMKVACGKGTYIRTLSHDIGELLGCGAHMNSLRRTKSGGFTLKDAYTLEQLLSLKEKGELEDVILPTDRIFDSFVQKILDEQQSWKVGNGIPILADGEEDGTKFRLYDTAGRFLCISTVKNNKLVMDTSFWCED